LHIDTEVQPKRNYETSLTTADVIRAIVFWIAAPVVLITWYGMMALMFQLPGSGRAQQALISFCNFLFRLSARHC
jgi:hypothetical protein